MRCAALICGIVISTLSCGVSAQEAQLDSKLFVVHFSTGSNWDHDKSPQEQDGFSEHSSNLKKLRSEGRIRFGARYEEFGMIIIDGSSLEAVNELIGSDPGVRSGIFTFTVASINVFYEWREPHATDESGP